MINLNNFARAITLKEGLKKSVNIGQVKEILRLTFKELKNHSFEEVARIITKQK